MREALNAFLKLRLVADSGRSAAVLPFNTFWKLSPVLVALLLLVGLFIPMGWGAPSGPAAVVRNSVQIIPSVAGEVVDVPVLPNTSVKEGDILFRIDPTTYAAQVDTIEAQLKFAELRLSQMSELQRRDSRRAFDVQQARRRWTRLALSSRLRSGTSTRPSSARRPTATSPISPCARARA